ncbi:MAG: Zn-dependent exopeptidase, partial [Solirubrobacterales bacterium]|nr:Zn-dependent exopeptidase [Solirubrobacterales bacterium]
RLMQTQVDFGQRPAGSAALRALAVKLRPLLPHGRFQPIAGEPGLRNVVGSLPGTKPAIVLGAHYDTLAKPKGFVGANNGASGTAILIEAARALSRIGRPAGAPALRFVLFDGEEPAQGLPEEQADFYAAGLRGSRAYAARAAGSTRAMLLLDYVANKGLRLPREGTSDRGLWAKVRAAAARAGKAGAFPAETGVSIIDDHTPFLRAGVPAVDFIDWSYDGHSLSDGMDKISLAATDAVGETVVELLRTLR